MAFPTHADLEPRPVRSRRRLVPLAALRPLPPTRRPGEPGFCASLRRGARFAPPPTPLDPSTPGSKLPSDPRCHTRILVPPSRFLTVSTACSGPSLRACCIPLPAGVRRRNRHVLANAPVTMTHHPESWTLCSSQEPTGSSSTATVARSRPKPRVTSGVSAQNGLRVIRLIDRPPPRRASPAS